MNEYVEKSTLNIFIAEDTTKGHYAKCADGSEVMFTHREVSQMIADCPAADVQPVVYSSWHDCYHLLMPDCYVATCKTCGKEHKYLGGVLLRYCPNCGATMR